MKNLLYIYDENGFLQEICTSENYEEKLALASKNSKED